MIVNGREINDYGNKVSGKDVYIYVDFVKSGRHFFTVNQDDEFYLHRSIIRNREEELVLFNKRMGVKKRTYSFEDSCFMNFREEYDAFPCFEHDQKLWKINNFVKKPDLNFELISFLQQHYLHIVQIFNFLKSTAG